MQLTSAFKQKAIDWADGFEYCCVLDSNDYLDPYGKYDFMVASGARKIIQTSADNAFTELLKFYECESAWMFGSLGYDLKNGIEALKSENHDDLGFPELFFFVPEYLIISENGMLRVELGKPELLNAINSQQIHEIENIQKKEITIQSRISKAAYLEKVQILKQHIARGNIYELTFCQEFYAENASINPAETFKKLNKFSPAPFAGYLKVRDKYLLCASPERFLKRNGSKLISQPIKGTAKRGETEEEDAAIKVRLRSDLKEQTENVMIVDLVRNDLTKSAVPATVKVEEQFGIYSFAQVHQMISTISCELNPEVHFIEAVKNAFPMGSMTGAPKMRAMQLIEATECSKRGAFSGALGYITPHGAFDFNVVIRSILYAQAAQYLSFQVGGAITDASVPEKEYEECLIKASAIIKTIKGPQ